MQYFFILGKNPTLSLAEIVAVLSLKPEQVIFLSEEVMIADISTEIDAQAMIRRLGGTIKIGVINDQLSMTNSQSMINFLMTNIKDNNKSGKFHFGISYYGDKRFDEKKLGMEIKSTLKEQDISSRWVTSKEKVLSSVVVEQNKLVSDKGIEIVIFDSGKEQRIGHTLVVQPFKELSKRDYGRPGRDDFSGMLPPKLAQMMLNLGARHPKGVPSTLLDPFCGSGTILTEAALMGYQKLIGCDASAKAIEDTKKNFQWMQKTYNLELKTHNFFQCKVENLNQKVKPNSVDMIITEPYLGPSRAKRDKESIKKIIKELEELYYQAIKQFIKALKNNGTLVMIWPVFMNYKQANLDLNIDGFKIISIGNNNINKRPTLIYGRSNQKIWREIVVLEKN